MNKLIQKHEDVVQELHDDIYLAKAPNYLTWGVKEVDDKFGKPVKQDLIVMCGESGSGKTSYAFNNARAMVASGLKVLFCTLEMSKKGLMKRFAQQYARFSDEDYERSSYSHNQMQKINEVIEFCGNPNFTIAETDYNSGEGVKVEDLITEILFNSEEKKFDFIFIDALQFLKGSNVHANEKETVDDVLSKLLSFVNSSDGVPVCLLHHFVKGTEGSRTGPRGINQLMGSAKIEHKATRVVQIWRDIMNEDSDVTKFIVMKDRWNGKTGMIDLQYNNAQYRVSTL